MFILNEVSGLFREYVTATSGTVATNRSTLATKPVTHTLPPHPTIMHAQYRPLVNDLHDTLDVTVFM
jgi:hypothetical protein